MKKRNNTIKAILIVVALLIMMSLAVTGCGADFSREMKTIKSNMAGGMDRTVTVYDYSGGKIAEYKGKIDVETNEGKVLFDLDGKRTIIYNAPVIVQEN